MSHTRPITCLETNKTYPSISEAARQHNTTASALRYAASCGGMATGYHWYFDNNKPDTSALKRTQKSRSIVCVETGIVYQSTREAATAIGVHRSAICHALKNQNATCKGFHWRYIDPNDKRPTPRVRRIECVETKEIYQGIKATSRQLEVTPGALRTALKLGTKCCGYHWRFVDED